ncbi:hypothetical protein [Amphibiibacter pelophylacis]|uniref:Uncharacterized protein n=1 Tax=Amphibiibacter pelophylacis TaxID=1799477 RepID=A0ACC6NZK6_9BURK
MKIIKLMTDYGCFPLWHASGEEVGDIDPNDLPLSQEVRQLLADWARAFDQTLNHDYPPDSGFKSEADEVEFKQQATRLAEQLREELGPEFEVIVKV